MSTAACTSEENVVLHTPQLPMPFTEFKTILLKLAKRKKSSLSTSSDPHCRPIPQANTQERQILGNDRVFEDKADETFKISTPTKTLQTSIGISQQDIPKLLPPPSRRYVSSFKTLVNSTTSRQTQRLNSINNSVVIFKLSKDHDGNSTVTSSQLSNKISPLSVVTTSSIMSIKPTSQQQYHNGSPIRLSPVLKVEGKKRRIVPNDSSIIVPSTVDLTVATNPFNQMATTTSNHVQASSSTFTYRSVAAATAAAAGGNTVRQRQLPESTSNNILLPSDRFKPNLSSSIRSTKQILPPTSSIQSSLHISSQPAPRILNSTSKPRTQQEKSNNYNSKEIFEYPDPFTNCPQELLNKLSQLTKLQLETIEWERKRRFTKKKPLINSNPQGKDSP